MSEAATSDRVVAREWVVALRIVRPGTLPEWTGYVAMAGLLSALRRTEPGLAQLLHEGDGLKPYTVSPIGGDAVPGPKPGRLALEQGSEVGIRVTGLGSEGEAIAGAVGRLTGQLVLLDRAVGEVVSVSETRCVRVADLVAPAEGQSLRLRFASPTAFKRPDGALELLPTPAAIIRSARERWERWVGPAPRIDPEVLRVRAYRIKTVPVRLASHAVTGFVGSLDLDAPPEAAQPLWSLCRYLGVAGCGIKVTQGMGQTVVTARPATSDVPPRDRSGGGALPAGGQAPGHP